MVRNIKSGLARGVFVLATLIFMVWLSTDNSPLAQALPPLSINLPQNALLSYSCHIERVEYGCYSTCLKWDTKCNGIKIFGGLCLGKTIKECVEWGEKCKYKDNLVCNDNPTQISLSDPTPTPQESGDNVNVDGTSYTYTPDKSGEDYKKPDRHYSYRYVCSGRVIKSPYITGYEYIAKQKICKGADCPSKIVYERVYKRCIDQYKVCRMDGGTPKCVRYIPDVKISILAERIGELLHLGG